MKRILLHIPILLFVLVSACHTEQVEFSHALSSTYPILSRGGTEEASLANGSQILLNASGGLSVENGIFTYNGSSWSNGQELHWTDESMETTITALYPTYTDNRYTSENLYAKGMLEDILIAQETLPEKGEINLQFKHLFSSLTLFIEPTLDANIQELALSVPVQVEAVSASDGTFSLTDQTHTVVQSRNDSHAYSFILPPCDDCTLSLRITWKDRNVKDVPFSPHTFQSGTRYECNITSTDSRPGIRTADDLIDFSRLINGYEPITVGKTLDDFGEMINGVMTYRLLADIVLTEEDCAKLCPIGEDDGYSNTDTYFSDTFDGEGHTISNLMLSDRISNVTGDSGLFSHVEETGIVKNVHINNASSVTSPICKFIGIIAAYNNGIIDNCSVTNSTLYSIKEGRIGTISAVSEGVITNCYSYNNNLYGTETTYIGGIAAMANNMIVNCYSYKNNFIPGSDSDKIGSMVGATTGNKLLNIRNCYIYHNNSNWYSAIGLGKKASIKSFYYNKGNLTGEKIDKPTQDVEIYDTYFKFDGKHISTLLNNWIETTGKADDYINYTFRRWKVSNDGSACFQ